MKQTPAATSALSPKKSEACPINGLAFAPEWAGTSIYLKSHPVANLVDQLHRQELSAIANASELRQSTYSSGRHCARLLLREAGMPEVALPQLGDGSVQWPDGVLGSLSHTNDWAVAAVAAADLCEAQALGIDLERIQRLDQGVLELVATPQERDELAAETSPDWHGAALFSLKESIYKCLARDFGQFIGFHDVELSSLASGSASVEFLRADLAERYATQDIELRIAVTPLHVFTLAWLRAV